MKWQEVCKEPSLQDLPFKIELNRFGQIVMSPASNDHGRRQSRIIGALLTAKPEGEVVSECSIETADGTKVADVAWCSSDFHARHGMTTPFPSAPEICVEIVSPSNTQQEMEFKRNLYFEQGAREVWICQTDGSVRFYLRNEERPSSELAPTFPCRI